MTDPNIDRATTQADHVPAGVPTLAQAPKPKKRGGASNVLLVVALVVAVGGITFAVGRTTAPAAVETFGARAQAGLTDQPGSGPATSFDPANGAPAGVPGGLDDRTMTITGTVIGIDGSTMTITTADGTETAVDTSGSTYHGQTAATVADVTPGTKVSVSVAGLGGGRAPDASAAPTTDGAPAQGPITASDVTITSN